MGYRLNTAKTGGFVTQSVIYPKGAYILQMIRMMMWDPQTGDKQFKEMMRDFVKTHYNQNVSTVDFQAIVEKHMTKEMDLDGSGRMTWFFGEWVYGTEVPTYTLDYHIDQSDGKIKLSGKITQSDVSPNFKMRVPLYIQVDGRIVRLGSAALFGNSSKEFNIILPKKPERAMICHYEDVLCNTDDR
ncbi:MAG TPA: hypothetical protein VEZ90_03740 [Blastocatellia bacterium]|nr:hypothetical protein [Blastocatellia bacterium]